MRRLHGQLLQSAINGVTQRRDKALRDVIRYQGKLDVLLRKRARLERQHEKELKSRATHGAAQVEELPSEPVDTTDIPEADERFFATAKLVKPAEPAGEIPGTDAYARAVKVPAPQTEPDDLGIPEFLRRGIEADKAVRAEIEKQNAERKRTKSQVRIEKMKAKQSGATAQMPLTGKAALKFIKEGA